MNKIIGILAIVLLNGCATTGGESGWSKTHSFSINNSSILSIQTSGCNVAWTKLQNKSGKSVGHASGNLVVSNSNSNNTVDAYLISCPATLDGGESSCKLLKTSGRSNFTDYGGLGCPDMKFNVVSFTMI